jgi:hypothetical protein
VRVTIAFVVVAIGWSFGAAIVGDALGWNALVVPLGSALVVALFGWSRRGRDVVDVFAAAMMVSYAAFLGLALARIVNPIVLAEEPAMWYGSELHLRWPVVLLAGLAYALILTTFVAIPFALIPVRPRVEVERNVRFLSLITHLAHRDDSVSS